MQSTLGRPELSAEIMNKIGASFNFEDKFQGFPADLSGMI
jgi:hypothetical protein